MTHAVVHLGKKVGILMGGLGGEAEVSFTSGRTICDFLAYNKTYELIPIFLNTDRKLYILPKKFLHRGKISDFQHRLAAEATEITWEHLKHMVDGVFIAMYGRFAEDGTIQGLLELLAIPFFGSHHVASALSMDKQVYKKLLMQQHILVPKDITISPNESIDENILFKMEQANITLPVIVKPSHEGSSLGTSLVKKKEDLLTAVLIARTIYPQRMQAVLIEEYVEGIEFTAIMLENKNRWTMLGITELERPAIGFMDYTHKYMPGKVNKWTPARFSSEQAESINNACKKVCTILQMKTMGRIDGFITATNDVIIVDPNTFSGLAPFNYIFCQAAHCNLSPAQILSQLIATIF